MKKVISNFYLHSGYKKTASPEGTVMSALHSEEQWECPSKVNIQSKEEIYDSKNDLHELNDFLADSEHAKYPLEIGEFIFHQQCTKCLLDYGFGKKGRPDLSAIGNQGREDLLHSIRDHSGEIPSRFQGRQIVTANPILA